MDRLRILGVDPGLRATGFGVIERCGSGLRYVASGVIRVPEGELPMRLAMIYAQLREVIERYEPGVAAVEKVFVNVNPQSTLLLGQARGAAITALASAGLPVSEYTALQVKQAVVGYGRGGQGAGPGDGRAAACAAGHPVEGRGRCAGLCDLPRARRRPAAAQAGQSPALARARPEGAPR